MKKLLLVAAAVVALGLSSFAQKAADSKGISFQGIARDNTGNVYASKTVNVIFTIQNGTTTVYQESQNGLVTDVAGVFSTYIGASTATVATGNTYGSFADVDFSKQYNIQVAVAINGGSSVVIGSYALQAVPYSKYATLAGNAIEANHTPKADTATRAIEAANGVPIGTIVPYAGSKLTGYAGGGWYFCDGSALSRTEYPELYAAIGTMWGVGDGSTTFNVPDMRGMFMRGWSNDGNDDPDKDKRVARKPGGSTGNAVGSYQADEIVAHKHAGVETWNSNYSYEWGTDVESGVANKNGISSSTGGSETRPKNVNVMYIIKLK